MTFLGLFFGLYVCVEACMWPAWYFDFRYGNNFKLCVSSHIFSEILIISKKDWQLSLRYSNFHRFFISGSLRNASYSVNASRRFLESPRRIGIWISPVLREGLATESAILRKFSATWVRQIQLPILLWDSKILREALAWNASNLKLLSEIERVALSF